MAGEGRTVLEIATPQCVAEEFDGEIVALNIKTGIYCSIREHGVAVWRDLAAGHPIEVLASIPPAQCSQAVLDFVETLTTQGLMRPVKQTVVPSGPPESAALLANGTNGLEIEVVDDVRDIILLDPVHDIDEALGWPAQRNEP